MNVRQVAQINIATSLESKKGKDTKNAKLEIEFHANHEATGEYSDRNLRSMVSMPTIANSIVIRIHIANSIDIDIHMRNIAELENTSPAHLRPLKTHKDFIQRTHKPQPRCPEACNYQARSRLRIIGMNHREKKGIEGFQLCPDGNAQWQH
eukprot:672882_1